MPKNKVVYFLQESWLLMLASVVFGLLLALTEAAWRPRIQQNQINKFNSGAKRLLPDAVKFVQPDQLKDIVIDQKTQTKISIKKAVDASGKCIGWVWVSLGSGFADKIELIVAADADFEKIMGFDVLKSSETPGFCDKITIKDGFFQKQFKKIPAEPLTLVKTGNAQKIDSEIVAITGATVSSQAVVDTLNAYIEKVRSVLQQKGFLKNGR